MKSAKNIFFRASIFYDTLRQKRSVRKVPLRAIKLFIFLTKRCYSNVSWKIKNPRLRDLSRIGLSPRENLSLTPRRHDRANWKLTSISKRPDAVNFLVAPAKSKIDPNRPSSGIPASNWLFFGGLRKFILIQNDNSVFEKWYTVQMK